MADFLSNPSPPPALPPPPPLLPPGYAEFRIDMTPSALTATAVGSFLGLCLCCAFCYFCVARCVDNRMRKQQSNLFAFSRRTV